MTLRIKRTYIVRTVKKLSNLMRERNIELSQAKELLCGGKINE